MRRRRDRGCRARRATFASASRPSLPARRAAARVSGRDGAVNTGDPGRRRRKSHPFVSQDDLRRRRHAEHRDLREIQPVDQSLAKTELIIEIRFELGRELRPARCIEFQLGTRCERPVLFEHKAGVEREQQPQERQADRRSRSRRSRRRRAILDPRAGSAATLRKICDGLRARCAPGRAGVRWIACLDPQWNLARSFCSLIAAILVYSRQSLTGRPTPEARRSASRRPRPRNAR